MSHLRFPQISSNILAVAPMADLQRMLEALGIRVTGPLEDHEEGFVVFGMCLLILIVFLWEGQRHVFLIGIVRS
jgi:hypothetical protein